ncbi:hypothetical protein BRC63_10175 [Halobacteriales archaeon QH_10_70_21]|nr:MAG: hypothetical protein BRC63_10175 [Halobacteriales archaeon QH_10_70_21]
MVAASQDGSSEGSTSVDVSEGETGIDAAPAEPMPSLDVVFDVLQNRRRRLVLAALEDDGETTLGDLAERIAGIENDKPPESLDSQERKRVYVGLYQSHLPKMDDAGAVRFDDDRGSVERGPHMDVFCQYLDDSAAEDETATGYYLGVAAASVLGFVVALFASQAVAAVTIALLIAAVGVAGARATG